MSTNTNASGLPVRTSEVTSETEPFWTGLAEGSLRLPRCCDCDAVIWYPRAVCPLCGGSELEWITASGRGTVYSYSVVHKTQGRWNEHVPFVLAYVELDEGPRVMTNIVGCDPSTVSCGQAVEAVFDPGADGMSLLRFSPA